MPDKISRTRVASDKKIISESLNFILQNLSLSVKQTDYAQSTRQVNKNEAWL